MIIPIIYICLVAISLLYNAYMHGKPIEVKTTHEFPLTFVKIIMGALILWQLGFFKVFFN